MLFYQIIHSVWVKHVSCDSRHYYQQTDTKKIDVGSVLNIHLPGLLSVESDKQTNNFNIQHLYSHDLMGVAGDPSCRFCRCSCGAEMKKTHKFSGWGFLCGRK